MKIQEESNVISHKIDRVEIQVQKGATAYTLPKIGYSKCEEPNCNQQTSTLAKLSLKKRGKKKKTSAVHQTGSNYLLSGSSLSAAGFDSWQEKRAYLVRRLDTSIRRRGVCNERISPNEGKSLFLISGPTSLPASNLSRLIPIRRLCATLDKEEEEEEEGENSTLVGGVLAERRGILFRGIRGTFREL